MRKNPAQRKILSSVSMITGKRIFKGKYSNTKTKSKLKTMYTPNPEIFCKEKKRKSGKRLKNGLGRPNAKDLNLRNKLKNSQKTKTK